MNDVVGRENIFSLYTSCHCFNIIEFSSHAELLFLTWRVGHFSSSVSASEVSLYELFIQGTMNDFDTVVRRANLKLSPSNLFDLSHWQYLFIICFLRKI